MTSLGICTHNLTTTPNPRFICWPSAALLSKPMYVLRGPIFQTSVASSSLKLPINLHWLVPASLHLRLAFRVNPDKVGP
jgi:hypothetical protein